MKHIIFVDDWKEVFQSAHLTSFDDLFHFTDGKVVNHNSRRQVLAFSLNGGDVTHQLFMKRFFNVHLKDMLFALWNFRRPTSQARAEFDNAQLLIENGIDSYHPVAFGEVMAGGLEKQSFLITRKMSHQCLKDFMVERWKDFSEQQKAQLVSQLARFIRKIHDAYIHLPDLYSYHVYITPPSSGGEYQFAVIDLHRMQSSVRSFQKFVKDLAALFYSIPESYLTDDLKQHFHDEYARGCDVDPRTLQKQIDKRIEALAARRRPPKWD